MAFHSRLVSPVVFIYMLFAVAQLWAFKDFVMPKAENASTYPSKDSQPNEKITVAVDLYNTAPKDDIFNTHYLQEGILPVFLVITNDGDKPISVTKMRAELVTAGHSKLESLTADDVTRRVLHVNASSASPGRVGPIPIPGGNKNKKAQQQIEEINRAKFSAFAVEPHSTQSGFLFFDIQDVRNPTLGAHVYLTGVRDATGNEMMYFDIPVIASNAAGGN
ncbi:MAG TPA: hypothetical protein VII29_09605 [Terriglobales bacterium]